MLRGQEWCIMIPVQVVYGVSIANTLAICNGKEERGCYDRSDRNDLHSIFKTVFTGSEKGTNFMIRKISGEEGEPDKIQAITWPGPFIFFVTEDEKKTYQEFEFSENGIKAAVAWLNEVTHSA